MRNLFHHINSPCVSTPGPCRLPVKYKYKKPNAGNNKINPNNLYAYAYAEEEEEDKYFAINAKLILAGIQPPRKSANLFCLDVLKKL